MTKFNKRVLAVAIAGAIMLPGVAAAAELEFGASQQITFARDLIVNSGTTIETPNDLVLIAEVTDDGFLNTVGNEDVTVKVTLTNGAKFDTTADAPTLVATFQTGTQAGAAVTPLVVIGTPYYSTDGQELNFTFTNPAAVNAGAGYFLQMNSFQITSLKTASDAGQTISAEVTVQNLEGQQVLASRSVIADFEWGISSFDLATNAAYNNYRIDVAACAATGNRTRFAPNGSVGDSCATAAPANTTFNVGGLTLDITEAEETDGATDSYINNFNATSANPEFNVVNTATWTFTVTGGNLNSFTGGDLFLSSSDTCATVGAAAGTIAAGATSAAINVAATNALVENLSLATPGPADIYVCVRGDDTQVMIPQELSIAWTIDYDLPTQRVNPPGDSHDLLPLLLNGTTITFQNVNPASNPNAQSFLRITNHNSFACPIEIDAKDDAGEYTRDPANGGNVVLYTLPAQGSKQFNIDALESGHADFTGMLGDGAGKWYVRVTAECANVVGSAWVRNAADNGVGNMTDERNDDTNLFGTW